MNILRELRGWICYRLALLLPVSGRGIRGWILSWAGWYVDRGQK